MNQDSSKQSHQTQQSTYNVTQLLRNAQDTCMMDMVIEIEGLNPNPLMNTDEERQDSILSTTQNDEE